MEHFQEKSTYTVNKDAFGRVRILDLGTRELLLDQPNLITYQGADMVAKALAGAIQIKYIYVGYSSATSPSTSVALTDNVSVFTGASSPAGYVRMPLSFTPGYAASTSNYSNNLIYFTTYITGSGNVPDTDKIYHLGLAGTIGSTDYLFSHITFSPIQYSATYGISITWGLTFVAS